MIDLHLHSACSTDGNDEPEQFVERAYQKGVTTMSITEHSNLSSLSKAGEKARELGIDYINGIEMGGRLPLEREPVNVDILGYFFNHAAPAIRKLCDQAARRAALHTEALLAGLSHLDIPILYAQVQSRYPEKVSGWAIRRMLREQGYAKDKPESSAIEKEAIKVAIRKDRRFRPLEKPANDAGTIIEAIHQDGGIAMMAHPFWLTKPSRGAYSTDDVWRQIECFMELQGDGLEAVNHGNDAGYAETVLEYCQQQGIPASGGTDAHRSEDTAAIPINDVLVRSMRNYRLRKTVWQ